MTSPTSPKIPCSTCSKTTGVFTGRSCQKDFCMSHASEHRQELDRQIDELTIDHDQFRQNLIEQTEENSIHPLIKQIDEWEEQSITKIHRTADEIRKQVKIVISKHISNLSTSLTNITDELRED